MQGYKPLLLQEPTKASGQKERQPAIVSKALEVGVASTCTRKTW